GTMRVMKNRRGRLRIRLASAFHHSSGESAFRVACLNMRSILIMLALIAPAIAEEYVLGADSQRREGVPKGAVTKHTWTSKIFPGTTRDWWTYVPAQYKQDKPAAVMVFQDGAGLINEQGRFR